MAQLFDTTQESLEGMQAEFETGAEPGTPESENKNSKKASIRYSTYHTLWYLKSVKVALGASRDGTLGAAVIGQLFSDSVEATLTHTRDALVASPAPSAALSKSLTQQRDAAQKIKERIALPGSGPNASADEGLACITNAKAKHDT